MKLKELFESNITENIETDFQSVFDKVINKLGFQNLHPVFDSSSTDYGLKTFLKAEKILLSLLPDDDEDFIGIIGKNGSKIYYVDKSGSGKNVNNLEATKLINKSAGTGILNV